MVRRALLLLIFTIAFGATIVFDLPRAYAEVKNSCVQGLSNEPAANETIRYVTVTENFRTPRGRRLRAGNYRLKLSADSVVDMDGLAEQGLTFDTFHSLLKYIDPTYADSDHHQFRFLKYRLAENSVRATRLKFFIMTDQTRTHDWENLSFIPTDESALYSQTNQTKRLFKKLKQLRNKYTMQTVPERIRVAPPREILEYYTAFYQQALVDLAELRIKNVEHPAEEKVNILIDNLRQSVEEIMNRESLDFRTHFKIDENPTGGIIDLFDLNTSDYTVVNFLRSHLRAAISEVYVALRLPRLKMVNTSLRQAVEQGFLKASEEAIKDLIEARVYDRELDILTTHGIYEVKAATIPDLYESRIPNSQSAVTSEANKTEREQKFRRQEAARESAIDILKKHGLVSRDFQSITVYVDGKLRQDAITTGQSYGLIDLPRH